MSLNYQSNKSLSALFFIMGLKCLNYKQHNHAGYNQSVPIKISMSPQCHHMETRYKPHNHAVYSHFILKCLHFLKVLYRKNNKYIYIEELFKNGDILTSKAL